jgi:hypothetical protein
MASSLCSKAWLPGVLLVLGIWGFHMTTVVEGDMGMG